MTSHWQQNLAALQTHRPDLFRRVSGYGGRSVGEIIPTPTGLPTLRLAASDGRALLAYDPRDPWRDAAVHLETVEADSRGLALFIGLGLGYGALRMLAERPTLGMMVLIEPCIDLFVTALHHVDLRPLIAASRVRILVGDLDLQAFEAAVNRIAVLEDTHILRHVPSFQWREDLYGTVDRQVFMVVNQLNTSGGTTRRAGEQFFRNRLANLSLLRHSSDLGVLKDLFPHKPAVLVAAGPSLDRSIETLRHLVGRCVLFCVDSALAPLLKAGIMPDFVTSIDFMDLNFEKMAESVGKAWPFSLICTPKLTPLIPKRVQARHLFWAYTEDIPDHWILNTLGIRDFVPATSSVAHLSLGSALLMGCDPIILLGQDLGYTTGAADHAAGTVIMQDGLPKDRDIFYVPGLHGGQVATDRALLSLQKKFEEIISENPGRTYLNATAAGARIEGAAPVALAEVATTLMPAKVAVKAAVDDKVASRKGLAVEAVVAEGRTIMDGLQKAGRQLKRVLETADQAVREIRRLNKERAAISSFDALPPVLMKKLIRFDETNRSLDAAQYLNEQVLELTFPALSENDRLRQANESIKDKEGYLPWLLAEIERIAIVSRERQKAFALYRELLSRLLHHLEAEGELLGENGGRPATEGPTALARLYCASGDYVLAREEMEKALAGGLRDGEAHLLQGEILAALHDFAGADAAWEKAAGASADLAAAVAASRRRVAEWWIDMADMHGNAGETIDDFPQLLPKWFGRVAAVLAPDTVLPDSLMRLLEKHAARLDQWLAAGAAAEVDLVLRGWEVFGERFPELLVLKARRAAAGGDAAAAAEALEKAVRREPGRPDWLALLARQLLEAGRPSEGLARLTEAVALDPGTAVLWGEIGDTLAAEGDPAGAAMAFERCFLALPDRLDMLLKMGDCYLMDHQPEAARAAYEAVLTKKPDSEAARFRLVRAQAMLKG